MLNTKKTTCQSNHRSEATYSGTVNTVTHKTIVVFIPELDVEVDVQRNPDASVQNGSVPEVGILQPCRLCSKTVTMLPQLSRSFHSRTSVKTFPSMMKTSLMTIWMMRKQRSMTGTTNLP